MTMKLSYFPLALCLAAALSLNSPGLMAADKKHSKKDDSHHVANRGGSPQAHSDSHGGAPQHIASNNHHSPPAQHSHAPQQQHIASNNHRPGPAPHSRAPQQQFASNSHHHSSNDHQDRMPISHTQLTSRSVGHDSDRVIHHSPNVDRDRDLAMARSSSSVHHSSSVNRDRDRDLAMSRSGSWDHHSSPSTRQFASSSHYRDRSHYAERHEHHSSQWYRDNGWEYDRDYWTSHHHHRYYNDSLGIYVIDNTAPYYYPGYDSDYGYDSGYGYGYSRPYYGGGRGYYGADYQTRLAVQDALAQAGYYNGPIDGVVGAGTRAAISNYQYDNGLPETGIIDNSLLQSLGL